MIFRHFVRFSNKFAAKVLLFLIYARKIEDFWEFGTKGAGLRVVGIKKATPKGR